MRKTLVALAIGSVALFGAALGAPHFLPSHVLKSWAIGLGERLTGYPIAIAGSFKFSVFPRLTIEASDVRIASRQAGRPDLLSVAKVEVAAELAPLALFGTPIHVGRVNLVDPVLHVAVDADGHGNWGAGREAPSAAIARPRQAHANPDQVLWPVLHIGEMRLTNGRILYEDARDKRRIETHRFEGITRAPKKGSFTARARMAVNGQPVEIAIETGSVKGLLAGSSTPLAASMQAPAARLEYTGSIARRQFLVADGDASLTVGSATALQGWLGRLFPGPMDGPIHARSRIVISGNRVAAEQLRLELGMTKATGEIAIVFGRIGPGLQVALTADTLDLTPFVDADALGRWRPSGEAFPAGRSGDADIHLVWRVLRLGPFRLGPGEVGARLGRTDRSLEVEFSDVALFGGNLRGQLRLGMAPGKGSLEGRIELHRVIAAAALGMVVEDPPLDGQASLAVDLSGSGRNPAELFRSLRGQGTFSVVDGALLNPRLADAVKGDGDSGPVRYQHLTGSFSAAGGVLKSPDLVYRGGKVDLIGAGEIDLSRAWIDFAFKPVGGTVAAKGGETKAAVAAGALRIAGPWGEFTVERRPPL